MPIVKHAESDLRKKLLIAGAKNLIEFGYPDATKDNILETGIFRAFFDKMLEESLGRSTTLDSVINRLRAEIVALDKKGTHA